MSSEALLKISFVTLTLSFVLNALLSNLSRGLADLSMLAFFTASLLLAIPKMRFIPLLPLISSVMGFAFEYLGLSYGIPFGSYTYLKFRGFTIFGVPVPVIIAWGVYTYTCYLAASHLSYGKVKILITSFLMVLLDSGLDPVMVELGVWEWRSGRGPEWFGVPLSNFLGWFVVSLISVWLYALISRRRDLSVKLPHQAYIPYLSIYLMLLLSSGPASRIPAGLSFSVALLLFVK